MGFTIDIEGDLNRRLNEMTEEVKQIIDNELYAFGLDTVAMAKNLAPVDEGTLRNLITFDKLPPPALGVEIISAASYSAYVEYGTGKFAAAYVPTLPIELQEYARTFFVNGLGRIPARPFIWPAIEKGRKDLIDRLKAQIG